MSIKKSKKKDIRIKEIISLLITQINNNAIYSDIPRLESNVKSLEILINNYKKIEQILNK